MSQDSDPKLYHFPGLEDQDGARGCRRASLCVPTPRGPTRRGSNAQLRRMGSYGQTGPDLGRASEGSDSSGSLRGPPAAAPPSPPRGHRSRQLPEEDVEMKSSGSSGSGTESHGDESRGNQSHGNGSTGSSNGNSKDSALLTSSGSNKSSTSHSPSIPSSSNAFSLLSSEQDNPSTSGCSSEESAKAKTQKELLKTLKELKLLLPAEKRSKGSTSSTLNTLKYALRCVKQVEANEEYYQLLRTNDGQPSGVDVPSYTIEEIDSITSEYTLKNNDIFAAAVSLNTGRIVYISDQAASILNCKREVFQNAKFVEFLSPQDVSVFHSFTTPYRLPSWSMCTGAESSPPDCMQEKSFFCRISGGKERAGDLQYLPFRMTPYLMKVQDSGHPEDHLCCLLLAERVHSGYDAPRIPTDKRVFTTTHTPTCVFQDVDERAVPLLGYLPQDLIGTAVLLHLHPDDRQVMLGIHRKILQFGGQPFDHSSIRFCAHNGEYIILDTSWSSFVNPWSRKVSFVIGRHKVRIGPVNEDVFVAPAPKPGETKAIDPDVPEITEQIHRLLLQPVHNTGTTGYSSVSSDDLHISMSSPGESVGHKVQPEAERESSMAKPRTFQEICKGLHRRKSQEQQLCLATSTEPDARRPTPTAATGSSHGLQKAVAVVQPKDSTAPLSWRDAGAVMEVNRASIQEVPAVNDQTVYSYQQINCLDSVIRYLDSCTSPVTMKRKCESTSLTLSSNSEEDDQQKDHVSCRASGEPAVLKDQPVHRPLGDADKKPSESAPTVVGAPLPLPVPDKPESVVSLTSQCSYSSTIVHVGDKKPQPESEIIEEMTDGPQTPGPHTSAVGAPLQERESSYKKLGLTKQVLAAHTQKEEQAFLCRIRELRGVTSFKADCSHYLERQRGHVVSDAAPAARTSQQPGAAPGARRYKKTKSKRVKQNASSDSTVSRHRRQPRRGPLLLPQGLNQTSWSASETSFSTAYPAVMPGGYPVQVGPGVDPSLAGYALAPSYAPALRPAPYEDPVVAPVLALILPNYLFPQMGAAGPPPQQQAYYPTGPAVYPPPHQPPFHPGAFGEPRPYGGPPPYAVQPQYPPGRPFAPRAPVHQPTAFPFPPPAAPDASRGSSTPGSPGWGQEPPPSPLIQSSCSSPLQLNLLQLEEWHRPLEWQDGAALPPCGLGGNGSEREKGRGAERKEELQQASSPGDGNNSDATSSSSDMMDIFLQEDSCSATSGSMGSGSNGCDTSNSGTSKSRTSMSRTSRSQTSASGTSGSGIGSNDSSQYFGSVDSSQTSQKANGQSNDGETRAMEGVQSEHFNNDVQRVLRQDRDKLRQLQKSQPHFSQEQRRELMEVHPWLRRGCLPKAVDIKLCSCCKDPEEASTPAGPPCSDGVNTQTEIRELSYVRKPSEGSQCSAGPSCSRLSPGPLAPPTAS
ncbi:period circadian protein homolog 2 isoform X2 [Gadus macrocephalus]|uniref:period circadian protein homolog 2 isoform X2 n=1 Tax=Gadus macrocephalus TaxID=80720 RepID=UPI0028CB9C4E|nr:period circadian protein homolog 2 isoform X2 [Gadus macrocephalus]